MASFALEHLTFTYPGQTRPALSDLTLTIPEGAVTVLCGESGSGKSTLLRQLKTCLTPHGTVSGAVRLGDALLKGIPFAEQARRIGFVLQHPDDQIVTDKVFHELAFGLESLGCDEKTMRLCVAEMASYFGIADWFDRDVAALSGGQKQILNLASVVVMRPDVLILDEPTSQLDPIAASTFLHTLRKLNEELGLTILLSEQRLEEAVPLADHLIVLEQGRLLAAGAPQEVAAAVRGHAIFSAMPTAARIAAALGETECLPLTVRAGRAYLGRFAPHPMPAAAPAPVDTPPVLTVRDGWFRYAQGSADVLRNFSLTLRPGELYALTGSNGSGKTTALGVLSGRLRLYRGSVYLDGKKQRALQPLRDGIAAVPQDPRTLFAADTVRADLASLGRDAALVDTVVRQMALAPLLDRHPFDLSGGEQQRAALAKVLLMQPRVLLLDEPTKGMDGAFKAEFGALLRTLCAQGTAVGIVSHDVEFCAQYADRCGLLFRGEVVTENDPRTFFSGNYFYTTAAARIADGKRQRYDIGRFGEHFFSYVAAFGAFSWLSYTTDQKMKNALGHTAYILDAIKDVYKIKPEHVRMTANGVTYEDDYIFGAVCNSTSVAGTIELPADIVDTADGLFEVILVKMPETIFDLNSIITAILNQDYTNPFITFFQAATIDIDNAPDLYWALDGECSGGYEHIHIEPMRSFLDLQGAE